MDERPGELRPLAHPLRVRADRAIRGVSQVDRRDRPGRGGIGVGNALEGGVEPGELAASQEGMDGLAFGDETDVAVHLGSAPGALALDQDGAGRRREETGHQVEERRLAGAVGSEEAGHAGPEAERDVVDRDDVAVPARDVFDLERGRAVQVAAGGRNGPAAGMRPARRLDGGRNGLGGDR